MTQEQQLLDSLETLKNAVEQLASQKAKPDLIGLFEQIDMHAKGLPQSTHPTLLHYLQRKSYEKARLFLLGRDAENASGNCHGHSSQSSIASD